jgi:molecular chaperone DnaK (HSP70)
MDEHSIIALLLARASQLGIDMSSDATAYKRITRAAEIAAEELQHARTTEVNLPYIGATAAGPVHLLVTLPDAAPEGTPRLDPRVKLS